MVVATYSEARNQLIGAGPGRRGACAGQALFRGSCDGVA
jgi:hypothetical protein